MAPEKLEPVAYEMERVLNNLGPYKIDRLSVDELKDNKFKLTLVSNSFEDVPSQERMGYISSAIGDQMASLGTVEVVAGTP